MADTTQISPSFLSLPGKLFAMLAGFGRGVSRALTIAQNASSIAQQVDRLNATTDAQLAAKGKTRADEVNRIFAKYNHI